MKKLLLFIFCILSSIAYSQAPAIQWQKNFGGSLYDGASYVLKVSNGYIVSGYSESNNNDLTSNYGGIDAWLYKLDNLGVLQWQKNYGGSGDDYFTSIKQTSDGGYILGGSSSSNDIDVSANNGGEDYWIVKVDSLGTIQWEKNYGGSQKDDLNSIQVTCDGGYVASGYTRSPGDGDVTGYHSGGTLGDDLWIIKLDSLGNLQWEKCFGGSDDDTGYEIKQTNDMGYIIAGVTASLDGDVTLNNGGDDFWIVKIDSLGVIQWQKCYGGSNFELANYIQTTFDGGYIIAGQASSSDGDLTSNYGWKDCWIVKVDSLGSIEWQKNFGGTGNEIAFSVAQNSDSSYVVLSSTNSNNIDVSGNHGNKDIWLFKLKTSGTIVWQKCFGGSLNDEAFFGLDVLSDGTYVIAGYSASNDMDLTGNYGNWDSWVLKLDVPMDVYENSNSQLINIYPNPSNGQFLLSGLEKENTIEIFDVLGQKVFQVIVNNEREVIDISNKTGGVYLYRITDVNKIIQQGKIIVR